MPQVTTRVVGPAEPGALEKRLLGPLVRHLLYRGRRAKKRWPAPDGSESIRIRARDGAGLAGLWTVPDGPVHGVVVLAHPDRRYGKHWFVKQGWIDWLTARGYASLAFDFAVYGESRGGNVYLHEHVVAAVDEAHRRAPEPPLHLVGLSIGAFAAINASVEIDDLASLILESPYPTFVDWYEENGHHRSAALVRDGFQRLFPTTYARIDAGANIARANADQVLVVGLTHDEVTPIALTRQVADAAPSLRSRYLELGQGQHLSAFEHPTVQAAIERILDTSRSRCGAGVYRAQARLEPREHAASRPAAEMQAYGCAPL